MKLIRINIYLTIFTFLSINLITIDTKKHNPGNFLICSKYNCPLTQGVCTRENRCACFDRFVTVNNDKYGDYQCNYERKSQTVAFLLEFIMGFGVGHFYLENFSFAIIKLIFSFSMAFFICFFPHFSMNIKSQKMQNMVPYLQTLFGVIYCIWQISDGVLIGINYYKDGNGIDIYEW